MPRQAARSIHKATLYKPSPHIQPGHGAAIFRAQYEGKTVTEINRQNCQDLPTKGRARNEEAGNLKGKKS
jgi:hypothetical protein